MHNEKETGANLFDDKWNAPFSEFPEFPGERNTSRCIPKFLIFFPGVFFCVFHWVLKFSSNGKRPVIPDGNKSTRSLQGKSALLRFSALVTCYLYLTLAFFSSFVTNPRGMERDKTG